MRYVRVFGVVLGFFLFYWILQHADLAAVWGQIRGLRWRFAVLFSFYAIIFALDTMGWKWALNSRVKKSIPWHQLFRIRLAGEALNYVTPSAWIGGEPVKAILLSKRCGIPFSEGMASVVIAKTTFSFSMFLFIVIGLIITVLTQSVPVSLYRWIWSALGLLVFLLSLFVAVQFFKPFQRAAALGKGIAPAFFERIEHKVKEWDAAIVSFYRDSPRGVFWSLTFHFLGWMAGVVEIYLILRFLHVPVSWATAWSLEALWILLKSAAFLIPASLGASEGLLLLICVGFGINTVSGLALGLIRRARELAWVGLGLVEFSKG